MAAPPLDPTGAAEFFLAGARDAGLGHICISPGSRSTPLAVAALRTEGITTSVHLDERVGAFSALGRALLSGRPVGLICTSGTAGANYLPAVSEASMSNVPLLIMTADRPPEHQSWGVGQTFDQGGLYHRQVRAEFTMPVGGAGGADHALRAGWRAGTVAIERSGPVHVNWPFRLPLEPVTDALTVQPTLMATVPSGSVSSEEIGQLGELVGASQAPLIIAGPAAIPATGTIQDRRNQAERFCATAEALGIPILADLLSGLRGAPHSSLVSTPSLVLNRADIDGLNSVDLIIRVGQTPTAKATRLWWETQHCDHVLLDPADDWNDPSHLATHRLTSDPVGLLEGVHERTGSVPFGDAHLKKWVASGEQTSKICHAALNSASAASEPAIAAALSEHASEGDIVVASSSMPVRDLDTFAPTPLRPSVFSNRGVNGIDGVVSTAAGIAAEQQAHCDGRTYLLIGDVALLHDIGGVLDAARNGTPLTIVVPNNDGGGIFSFLPAKDALDDDTFTTIFQTPHGTTFSFLAGHEGISHHTATDVVEALRDSDDETTTVNIIEVIVDVDERLDFHKRLLADLAAPTT